MIGYIVGQHPARRPLPPHHGPGRAPGAAGPPPQRLRRAEGRTRARPRSAAPPSSDSTRRSSSRTRCCSSGSCANTALDLSQARLSMRRGAGDDRARLDRARDARLGGRRSTPSPIVEVAGDADLAGERDALADASCCRRCPTWPASTLSSPIVTEWPICTRLSILVPRPIRVSCERRAVDRGERADLDVVLDHHDPDLRDLVVAARPRPSRSRSRRRRSPRRSGPPRGCPGGSARARARPSAARSPRRPRRRRRARRAGAARCARRRAPGPDDAQRAHVHALAEHRARVHLRRRHGCPARAAAAGAAARRLARRRGRDCRRRAPAAASRVRGGHDDGRRRASSRAAGVARVRDEA